MKRFIEILRSAADRVHARTRIAIGLVLLLIGVLLLAMSLGVVPDEQRAITAARSKFCEAVAVQCSAYLQRREIERLRGSFEATLRRDQDITSGALRREDGTVVMQFGGASAVGHEASIAVPIWLNDQKWGTLEIGYDPLVTSGIAAFIAHPQVRLILFVCAVSLGLFLIYLRKMLQHLDPSKVVPPRVRSALDTLAEGLLVLDHEQRIVLANQAFAATVGKSPDELMGVKVSHFGWQAAHDLPIQPWDAVMQGQTPAAGVLMKLADSKSVLRTFSVNCSPVLGNEGKLRGVLVSFDDVTQLQRKEIELRKSKEEAEHANQAKSDFLARMSHEIRTPMNAILGFTDILRRGYEESEAEREEYLEIIHSSGQHLLELINDILDLSKIEAGKLEVETSRCSPHELISSVISILSVRAEQKGIELSFEWNGMVPETIETDPTRLRQALTNLVGNAIKFTETGSVKVVARLLNDPATPKLSIDVIDSGIGMKADVLARIFQPFAQADTSITRRFGGTGLGLSISKQIAEALGGGIDVRSEFGKGTTFTLTVNVGRADQLRFVDISHSAKSNPDVVHGNTRTNLAGIRLLIAEDGVSNRKLISLVLGRAGAVIDCAEDGQAAVEMASTSKYDAILMDMQMPVMDGYTAATTLRNLGDQTPIIALTAHAMRGDEEKCRAAGCTGFVTKPIDMDKLMSAIAEAVGAKQSETVSLASTELPVKISGPALQSTLPTGDPEFCQIVEEFIARLHEQVGAIGDAWTKGDLDELASLAHWVKGSGGTAGFPALTPPARRLEQAAREKQLDDIANAIVEIREIAGRVAAPVPANSSSPPSVPMTAKEE